MHSSLRFFRYFVFGLFLACNAVIVTAAVWNLNLVQNAPIPSSLPLQTDAYLVFVGCAGLALIIPVLFCELASKSIFLVSVWFECIWVALFSITKLAGAASASAAGADDLCPPVYLVASLVSVDTGAICTSSRLLQAFSWIGGLILLAYFVLLFVTCLLMRSEDDTIWRCNAGKLPWAGARQKLATPVSPTDGRQHPQEKRRSKLASMSRRWSKAPTIAAPRPRNAASEAVRRAILSYRSGLSADYTIEHFRPEDPVVEAPPRERPLPPPPLILANEPPTMVTREATSVTLGPSLYPQHMHSVLPPERQAQVAPRAQSEDLPRPPPTPSPIGDWPRMNPSTPRPKRKSQRVPPLVEEARQRQYSFPPSGAHSDSQQLQSLPPAQSQSSPALSYASPISPLPALDFGSSAFSASVLHPPPSAHPPHHSQRQSYQPLSPPTSFPSTRSRPSGPRRPSLEENRNQMHTGSYSSRSNVPPP